MNDWKTLASDETLTKTAEALRSHGFVVEIVENGEAAKNAALKKIPEGSEVFTATSVTTDTIGLTKTLNESGKYDSVKQKLMTLDRKTQGPEMQKLGSAPAYVTGSVHAVTQDGHLLIASGTGSQLPAYTYGSGKVILLVGTQKVVKDVTEGMKRIYEYVLPLENERAKKAYGFGSKVRKLFIYNEELVPERTHVILIKESLGF